MLLQVAGARITAAPFAGVKPPNSESELPPQAMSDVTTSAAARFIQRT